MPFKNPEHKRAYDREYRRAHPDEARAAHERHYRKRVDRTYDGRCYDCGDVAISDWYCWTCLSKRQDQGMLRGY